MSEGRCARAKGEVEAAIDQRAALGVHARAAARRFNQRQRGRGARGRQQGSKAQAVTAEIVTAGVRLVRRGRVEVRDVRIGMRHRPELGNQYRDRGDRRKAKLEMRFQ